MVVRVTVAGGVGIDAGTRRAGEAGLGRLGRVALAYLVCERNRTVPRDDLAEVLWGERLPNSWQQLLRGLVSKIRATLSQAGLDATRALTTAVGGYQIHLPPDAVVDVEEASADLEAACAALGAGDAPVAYARASGVAAVAGRGFLPGAEGIWVERRQADLRALHVRALEVMSRAATARGTTDQAIAAAEEAVAIEPYRESAYIALMEAHAEAGSRGDALRAYERCRRLLVDELGVSPSPPTEAAYLALLGDAPAFLAAPAGPSPALPLPPALSVRPGGFVVGRDAELGRLTAAYRRLAGEGRQAVFLGGEPGIGKTTLVAAFARQAHGDGARVLYGRSDEALGHAYQPFAEALSELVAGLPVAELAAHAAVHGGELARLAPALRERLPGTPAPAVVDPDADRFRLFGAVAAILEAAATEHPVVLVLDDLHWAAPPTLVLLDHVLRATSGAPVLVVATYRHTDVGADHPLTQTLADLRRAPAVDRLIVRGLDEQEVGAFLQAAGAAVEDEPDAARAMHAHTSGNPFFVDQLLRHLRETGGTYRRRGTWSYYAGPDDVGIPEGVREVVARRLHRMPAPAQDALRWASVIGPDFGLDLLGPVAGATDVETLLDAIEAAVAAGLVVERGPGRYGFAHALVADTIYTDLTLTRRAHRHLRVAEALEPIAVDDSYRLPALVHHFAAAATAGGATRAADYAIAAAHQAFAQSAWEDAVALLERGLDALDALQPPDVERRCDLLMMLAETWCRFWNVVKAAPAAAEAEDLARALDSPARLARAARWRLSTLQGPDPAAEHLAEEALAGMGDELPGLRAIVMARLSWARQFRDETTADALALARRSGDPEALGVALFVRSAQLAATEQAHERLAVAEELVSAAPRGGWDGWRGRHEQRAIARLVLGDRDGFEADAASCDRQGREGRFWYYRAVAAMWRVSCALLDGRFDRVEALIEERQALAASAMAGPWPMDSSTIQRGRLALDLGRPRQARDILVAGLDRWPGHSVLASMLAVADADLGDTDTAEAALDALAADGFAPLGRFVSAGLVYLAEVAATLGDPGRAEPLYDRLAPYSGQLVAAGVAAHCPGAADRSLGQLASTLGRWAEAEAHFDIAVRMEVGIRSPPLLARTRYWYGRMLAEQGRPGDLSRAERLVRASGETADTLGMAGLAGQARELLLKL